MRGRIKTTETSVLVRSARILKRLLETWEDLLSLGLWWKATSKCWCEKFSRREIANWKMPGYDGIHWFWFQKFTSNHDRLTIKMSRCFEKTDIPRWMTKGKTTLIKKDPKKGTAPNNYTFIKCLMVMQKILTAQIREGIYYLLISHKLFPEEQKGCYKGTRGTGNLLYIDQHILKESKMRLKNVAMV